MTPSTLAMRYLYYEQDIIPERRIETGQRYRARKNLLEHVRLLNVSDGTFLPQICIGTGEKPLH